MKFLLLLLIMSFAAAATGQENSCFPYCYSCEVIVFDTKSKQKVAGVDFKPLTGEEELTSKVVDIPGTDSVAHASVFFTDESLASNAGYDSIRLGVAVAKKIDKEPKGPANASAEMTLNGFDTARVVAPVTVGSKSFVVGLECKAQLKEQK